MICYLTMVKNITYLVVNYICIIPLKKKKNKHNLEIYKINFGYTQVLFMGSVPRINYLLANVSLTYIYTLFFL